MVFKNLTSVDKRKKVLWASETFSEDGILTKIHKYLIYIIREINEEDAGENEKPEISILKYRDTREKIEKFRIRLKGGLYCCANGKNFHVSFCHTLKIDLSKSPEEAHS